MKIYKWIDQENHKVCLRINVKYFLGSQGRISYALDKGFYILYFRRMLLVLLSIIFCKTSIFKKLVEIIKRQSFSLSASYDRTLRYTIYKEFLWNLFGHGYFSPKDLLPLLSGRQVLAHSLNFPTYENPEVSIIIPVYNQLSYTFNCLLSLNKYLSHYTSCEVIIINDCSYDETHVFLSQNVQGITYLRNEQNLGFLGSCNKAASVSRGQYLCFLNNDTQIRTGWLESMVKLLREEKQIGCVGSKLIFPNGLLQEAGGIIYNDGSTGRYGSLCDASDTQFNFLKEVDYCSGASLLMRKNEFFQFGGFDKRYTPAYYEDTDLCMTYRHILHKKIVYQPLSELIHYERVSSPEGQANANLVNNKNRFLNKWKNELKQLGYNKVL